MNLRWILPLLVFIVSFPNLARSADTCVYVSDAGTQTIVLYHLNEETGALK